MIFNILFAFNVMVLAQNKVDSIEYYQLILNSLAHESFRIDNLTIDKEPVFLLSHWAEDNKISEKLITKKIFDELHANFHELIKSKNEEICSHPSVITYVASRQKEKSISICPSLTDKNNIVSKISKRSIELLKLSSAN